MIQQNTGDAPRKLLETQALRFVVFLDDAIRILGFDLENGTRDYLYQWRQGRPPQFYALENVGRSYLNHDAAGAGGHFASAEPIAVLKTCGRNLRRDVRATLMKGLRANR